MMKYTQWNISKAKKFVCENSDCELLASEYKNVDTKMEFRCGCGNIFETTLDKFRARNKRQCNECSRRRASERQRESLENIKRFIEVESKSGCKLLTKKYSNAYQKLDLECGCGNVFQVPWRHFKSSNQRQCQECGAKIIGDAKRLPIEEVMEEIKENGCKLLSPYKTITDKIKIKCHCGNIYYTSFGLFRDYDMNRCATCRSKNITTSKGEDKIRKYLIKNNLNFAEEYVFEDLKDTNKLRFDFAILNDQDEVKMLIEYDGAQHFGKGNFSDDTDEMIASYQRTIRTDNLKNEYCFKKAIPLLRIHYNLYPKINEILDRAL